MNDILQARGPDTPDAADTYAQTELLSPATQIVEDKDAYLGNAPADIGRRVAEDQVELFVVCHPAEAMLQQLARLTPDFIAIHDLGTTIASRLVAAVAAAARRPVQKLVIRRQGYGVALATIEFVELPVAAGKLLRVYSTQIDGDTQTRQQLAQVLLAHSRLGVLLVGELPAHALDSAMQPLRDALIAGPWPNRQLLLVPIGQAPTLATQAAALAGSTAVTVRTTPQVARPGEAWSYISGAWNRLTTPVADAPPARVPPAPAPYPLRPAAPAVPPAAASPAGPPMAPPMVPPPSRPADLTPMPVARNTALQQPQSEHQDAVWADYVQRCAAIKGVEQACIFDIDLQRPLALHGTQRMAERLAVKGALLHSVLLDAAETLGVAPGEPDAAVSLGGHYLLMRPMPGRPRVALHLMLDRQLGNIGMARAQLHQIDQALLGRAA
jgi:hypothetical protein